MLILIRLQYGQLEVTSGFQNVVPGPAPEASAINLSEMQIIELRSLLHQRNQDQCPDSCVFKSLLHDSQTYYNVETDVLDPWYVSWVPCQSITITWKCYF